MMGSSRGWWALAVAMGTGVVVSHSVFARGRDAAHEVVVDVREAREVRRDVQESFRWEGVLDAGQVVEIRGVNGPIEVVRGGDEVVVTADKEARRSDPAEVRIEVLEHRGGVTVCAVYPSRRDENRCHAGGGWSSSVRNNDTRVAFRVSLPAGVELDAQTVNGDVEALDLASDVRARTVNGDVEVSTTGFASARTVNGSLRAAMERLDPEGLEFETVNGSIELDLPTDIDADIDARWVNGGLTTDLPFRVEGRIGRHSAEGVMGQGGPPLRIKTVNGSIRIH